jgi:hypothetical protein
MKRNEALNSIRAARAVLNQCENDLMSGMDFQAFDIETLAEVSRSWNQMDLRLQKVLSEVRGFQNCLDRFRDLINPV